MGWTSGPLFGRHYSSWQNSSDYERAQKAVSTVVLYPVLRAGVSVVYIMDVVSEKIALCGIIASLTSSAIRAGKYFVANDKLCLETHCFSSSFHSFLWASFSPKSV